MLDPNLEQLQSVIQLDGITEIARETNALINEPNSAVQISCFDLFCQKTGHKIGTRNENSILLLLKICGKDVSGNLYNGTSFNVHPAWLDTSPESLNALMEDDPIGYACYCFDIMTAQFYQRKKHHDARLYPAADRYWSLARANALLSQYETNQLAELNVELARTVSFMPDAAVHLFTTIAKIGNTADKLAQLHCNGNLIPQLRESVNKTLASLGIARKFSKLWIERTRFLDLAISVEDAASRGPSNVRKQRVSKRMIQDAVMFNEIDKLFNQQGFNLKEQIVNSGKVPNTSAWIEKQKAREAEIALGLAELQGFTNLTFSDENDEDDETVEVRTIAIEPKISTAMAEISREVIKTIQTAPVKPEVKLSALQLLRAKKVQK